MLKKLGQKAVAVLTSAVLATSLVPVSAWAASSNDEGSESAYPQDFEKIDTLTSDSVLGLDFSMYQQDLRWHSDGYFNYRYEQESNVFSYVKEQGVNTISVKVAVDPSSNSKDEEKTLTLENAAKTVKAANDAGLKTNVVLMYSDATTYADDQSLPDGWEDEIEGEKLNDDTYSEISGSETWVTRHAVDYTLETLSYLKEQGANPTMVTIGNEVDYNFLGYSGNDAWRGWMALRYLATVVKDAGLKVGFSFAAKESDPEGIQWPISSSENLNNSWVPCTYDYVGVNLYTYKGFDGSEWAAKALSAFETAIAKTSSKDAQFYLSSVKAPRKSDDSSYYSDQTQAKTIYDLLEATSDGDNAGGLVVADGSFIGSYNSFFESDHAITSLATFAYAQGNKVDVTSTPTEDAIYKYGLESGLKDQKVSVSQISGMNSSAIRGVDISSYYSLKKAGVKFYDNDGNECSLLKSLADNGVNYVRLRIWNNPYNSSGAVYGGGVCDVDNMLELGKEASKYGMKLLLCFHYSDFWASPSIHKLPKAWSKDAKDYKKVAKDVYSFTKATVKKFVDAGCDVGMVQVGNEITRGFAGVIGSTYKATWGDKGNAKKVCAYLKAGSKAVREAAPKALVALHLESPYYDKFNYVMKVWKDYGIDYDVLGTSCYAFWSQYNDRLSQAQKAATKYGKLFCILETSWLNTLQDADGTTNQLGKGTANISKYKVGVQGQVDVLTDQYKTVLSKPNGLGAFYWEPAWIPVKAGWINWEYNKKIANELGTGWASDGAIGYLPDSKAYYNGEKTTGGSGWDNQSLYDFNGHPLQSLSFYKRSQVTTETQTVRIRLVNKSGKKIADDVIAKVNVGESKTVTLPKVNAFTRSSYKITITGKTSGIATQKVTYNDAFYAKASSSTYTYNGKKKKPKVSLYWGSKCIAKNLKKSSSKYTIKRSSAKKVGTHSIKVTVKKGKYKGKTYRATFNIKPKATKMTKVSAGSKKFTAKWKKVKSQTSGYQVRYSTKSTLVPSSTRKITSSKKTSVSVSGLKTKTKYYVQVRTYKKVKGKIYYGSWSKKKKVTTK